MTGNCSKMKFPVNTKPLNCERLCLPHEASTPHVYFTIKGETPTDGGAFLYVIFCCVYEGTTFGASPL